MAAGRWRWASHPAAVSAWLALGCYLNCLPSGFVFDDHHALASNADARAQSPLRALWRHDFWGRELARRDSHKSYRPLTILSFRLLPFDPRLAHGVNAVLHAACTAGVSALALRVWGGRGERRGRGGRGREGANRVALLSGLLFAAHPVHVEAVSGLVGRAEVTLPRPASPYHTHPPSCTTSPYLPAPHLPTFSHRILPTFSTASHHHR